MQTLGYPQDPGQERRISADQLRTLVKDLLVNNRMFAAEAEIVAARMLDADLRGIVSHGSRALTRYLPAVEMAEIDPRAQVVTESETAAVALLNGSQGMGHVAATNAMQLAIEKARQVGTGTVVVTNSHHYGAAGAYAMLAAAEGMIGYSTTTSGKPNVIAPGSTAGGETNHGMAWACPNPVGPPVVLDMAIAESSWGKIQTLAEYGIPIPEHWSLDESGLATCHGEEAKSLLPIAGPKGFGLAFFASILTSGLSGRKLAIEKTREVTIEGGEHFFYVIDPEKFVERSRFEERLAAAIQKIHALPTENNPGRVTLPGELEWERAELAKTEGLSLHRTHIESLEGLAKQHCVEVPWSGSHAT